MLSAELSRKSHRTVRERLCGPRQGLLERMRDEVGPLVGGRGQICSLDFL
jgi:ABC-type uncharacterized transport system ATPase component